MSKQIKKIPAPSVVRHKEKHLQYDDLTDVGGVLNICREKYKGYTIDFCFHGAINIPKEIFEQNGAELVDNCIETRVFSDKFAPVETCSHETCSHETCSHETRSHETRSHETRSRNVLVTKENFPDFAKVHDISNPDMYWTSERVFAYLDKWSIFMSGRNYIMADMRDECEIFVIEADEKETVKNLIRSVADVAFGGGKDSIMFMADVANKMQLSAVREIGFAETGKYCAYRLKL